MNIAPRAVQQPQARTANGQAQPLPSQASASLAALERDRTVDGLRWHYRRGGAGPGCLLLHGTGASQHSWDGLLPHLLETHDCLVPDLPGHGHSDPLRTVAPGLPQMAAAVDTLLKAETFRPELVIGHSAGAAIALRLALDGRIAPRLIVGVNAALMPYSGWLAPLARPLARAFSALGPVHSLLARRAGSPGTVERLIAGTGSTLDTAGIERYRELLSQPGHVEATLSMMANWELEPLLNQLPELETPVCLVVGEGDRTVPAREASQLLTRFPVARVVRLPGLGHLAHEEDPRAVFDAIRDGLSWSMAA